MHPRPLANPHNLPPNISTALEKISNANYKPNYYE